MRFALISEGVTDHVVLKNVLHGFFNDLDLEVNELYPKDRINPYGWTKVFEYCRSEEFRDSLNWCDHVIIQVDTDVKNDWGAFGSIPDIDPKDEKTVFAQIEKVRELLIGLIGVDFYDENKEKILFAIAVQSIECWFLPFHSENPAHYKKVVGCLDALNTQYLAKQGYTIDPNAKGYDADRYFERAAKPMRKRSKLKKLGNRNPSLKVFLKALSGVVVD